MNRLTLDDNSDKFSGNAIVRCCPEPKKCLIFRGADADRTCNLLNKTQMCFGAHFPAMNCCSP